MPAFEIISPLGDPAADLAERPFLNPGALRLVAGRKAPPWLPQAPGVLYVGTGSDLYSVGIPGEAGWEEPRRVGHLAEVVVGKERLARAAGESYVGVIFRTGEAKALAACVADDAQLDLPASKAERLIRDGQRIWLTRDVLAYALLEGVRAIGKANASLARARAGKGGEEDRPWTLRRLFGTIA